MQNKGLRCALNKDIEMGIADLHKEANLLKLHYRREQHTLNIMYDHAQVTKNQRVRSTLTVRTRSSSKVLLRVKHPYTEKFKHSLTYLGPKKWNTLPEEFHHTKNKNVYKSMVERLVHVKASSGSDSGADAPTFIGTIN